MNETIRCHHEGLNDAHERTHEQKIVSSKSVFIFEVKQPDLVQTRQETLQSSGTSISVI